MTYGNTSAGMCTICDCSVIEVVGAEMQFFQHLGLCVSSVHDPPSTTDEILPNHHLSRKMVLFSY